MSEAQTVVEKPLETEAKELADQANQKYQMALEAKIAACRKEVQEVLTKYGLDLQLGHTVLFVPTAGR